MTFDEFEDLFITRNVGQDLVDVYFEWARLVHAYRSYEESGELDCIVEEIRDLGPDEMKAFTPKRLQLLYNLSGLRAESINDLARRVHRNVKNVYQDLRMFKKLGLVNFKKKGRRNIVPETLVEEITFLIR